MNRLSFILFLSIFSFVLFSCSDEIVIQEDYTIKFGSECGWCAGQEFITVSSTKVEYEQNIPCGDDQGTIEKSMDFCSCEWNDLNASFDYSLYKKLDYNTCNVCADGCDEIIIITEDGSSHELRYSFSDKVEGMEDLRQKLTELMDKMREME